MVLAQLVRLNLGRYMAIPMKKVFWVPLFVSSGGKGQTGTGIMQRASISKT